MENRFKESNSSDKETNQEGILVLWEKYEVVLNDSGDSNNGEK